MHISPRRRDAMAMVSEYDIESATWKSLDSVGGIARNGGAKAYNMPHSRKTNLYKYWGR